jgi:catechol 2,3-dioxygenase-like lactoylglutathione lyase family enzyme
MKPHVSVITLGVRDLNRAKEFYGKGLGWPSSGFRGVTFAYSVRSEGRVNAVLAEAERGGGAIVQPARRTDWGGYGGYFADPDGYLWEVAHRSHATAFLRIALSG